MKYIVLATSSTVALLDADGNAIKAADGYMPGIYQRFDEEPFLSQHCGW